MTSRPLFPPVIRPRLLGAVVAGALAAACGGGDPAARSLVDMRAWTVCPPEDDPFGADPATAPCPAESYGYEEQDDGFFVRTDRCASLTVEQPLAQALPAGTTVRARVWHGVLQAPSPAEGHVGVALGDDVLWRAAVPIPAEGGLVEGAVTVAAHVSAGTPIRFHVDNHGSNTWTLLELSAP